jgi:ribosomal protein L37E
MNSRHHHVKCKICGKSAFISKIVTEFMCTGCGTMNVMSRNKINRFV